MGEVESGLKGIAERGRKMNDVSPGRWPGKARALWLWVGNKGLVVSRRSHWKADARVAQTGTVCGRQRLASIETGVFVHREELVVQQNRAAGTKFEEGKRNGRAGGEGNSNGSDSPERRDEMRSKTQTNAGPMQKSEKKTLGLGAVEEPSWGRAVPTRLGGCRGWQKL